MILSVRQGRPQGVEARGWGQSLVEFSLALPLFMLVLVGIAEGGYYVVATTAVSHATQEGARLGVLGSTANIGTVQARVVEAASDVISLSTSDITLELNGSACDATCYGGRTAGDSLGVNTAYQHRPLLSFVFGGVTFTANASADLLVE